MPSSEDLSATYIPALVCIMFGVYAFILRSRAAALAVEWNFRLLRIRFNARSYQVAFAIGGVAFILIGVLTLAGVIRFGPSD